MPTEEIHVRVTRGGCKTRKALSLNVTDEELERRLHKIHDFTSTLTGSTGEAVSPTVDEWDGDVLENPNVASTPTVEELECRFDKLRGSDDYISTLTGDTKCTGESMTSTGEASERDVLENTNVRSTPPKVTESNGESPSSTVEELEYRFDKIRGSDDYILITLKGKTEWTGEPMTSTVEASERDVLQNTNVRSTAPKVTESNGEPPSSTVEEWESDLLKKLNITSTPAKVTKSTLYDARKLFGPTLKTDVILRAPGKENEEITLIQFDPNFMSDDVFCRHLSCNHKNPEAAKSGKRDLFLCPHHQRVLRNEISEVLAKRNIQCTSSTGAAMQEADPFAGYTSLISLLDVAYHEARTDKSRNPTTKLKQEAILNVRNFLIITSTLLNPDVSNLASLPYVVDILREFLKSDCDVFVSVHVLRELVDIILSAFGIIFSWASLALEPPEAKIGAGTMGVIGGVVGFGVGGSWGAVAGAAAATYYGGLVGNGTAGLFNQNLRGTPKRPLYTAEGFQNGKLSLSVKTK